MKPTLQVQVVSWAVALLGIVLMQVHELFIVLVSLAAMLRPDLHGKEVFNHLLSSHPLLCRCSLGYMAVATATMLWLINSPRQNFVIGLGANALWLALWPLLVLFIIHEHKVYKATHART